MDAVCVMERGWRRSTNTDCYGFFYFECSANVVYFFCIL